MIKLCGLAAIVALAVPDAGMCAEQPIYLSSFDTPTIVRICNASQDLRQADACLGYIAGVFDEMALSHQICPPHGTTDQISAVGRKSLTDHPEQWNLPPAVLMRSVFKADFPCAAGK